MELQEDLHEIRLTSDDPDEDAFLTISVELTINGKSVFRNFRTRDVSHIDWNPNINDMADSILNPASL